MGVHFNVVICRWQIHRARHRHVPIARPLCHRYALGFSLAAALWLASLLLPAPWRFVLWGAAAKAKSEKVKAAAKKAPAGQGGQGEPAGGESSQPADAAPAEQAAAS